MSLGFSPSDVFTITRLAWKVVQNSRKACGAHDALTQETTSLHIVLQRLQREREKPDSILNRGHDGRLEELGTILQGCNKTLKIVDQVLEKYGGMTEEKRKTSRLRLKVQFGNGKMKDMEKIRQELTAYTSAITLFLKLLSMGTLGNIEAYMQTHSEELRELRQSLNWITASLQANSGNKETSILTTYKDDDKAIWKAFRRELIKEGFSSSELKKHKGLIKDYVLELGARGALDVSEDEEARSEVGEDDIAGSSFQVVRVQGLKTKRDPPEAVGDDDRFNEIDAAGSNSESPCGSTAGASESEESVMSQKHLKSAQETSSGRSRPIAARIQSYGQYGGTVKKTRQWYCLHEARRIAYEKRRETKDRRPQDFTLQRDPPQGEEDDDGFDEVGIAESDSSSQHWSTVQTLDSEEKVVSQEHLKSSPMTTLGESRPKPATQEIDQRESSGDASEPYDPIDQSKGMAAAERRKGTKDRRAHRKLVSLLASTFEKDSYSHVASSREERIVFRQSGRMVS